MNSEPFRHPVSALLYGGPGALLNWVALGFASANPGGYFWTDARMPGQVIDDRDPLAAGSIPEDHLSIVEPHELDRNDAPANAAIAEVVRSDEPAENIVELADFLRLPSHTQAVLSAHERAQSAILLVLSNGHRIALQYPVHTVAPIAGAITHAGASLLITFPDEAPQSRFEFDNVWRIRGDDPAAWGAAQLEVEKGSLGPPFTTGAKIRLDTLPALAPWVSKAASRARHR